MVSGTVKLHETATKLVCLHRQENYDMGEDKRYSALGAWSGSRPLLSYSTPIAQSGKGGTK